MPTEKPWWVPDRQTFNGAMVVLAIVIIAIYLVRVNGPGPESDALKILLGALIGGFIVSLLLPGTFGFTGFNIGSLIIAFIGAVILLLILKAIGVGRRRTV